MSYYNQELLQGLDAILQSHIPNDELCFFVANTHIKYFTQLLQHIMTYS